MFKSPSRLKLLLRNNNQLSFSTSHLQKNVNILDVEAQKLLDETYKSICDQKFEDIVVIKTKFNANPRFIILANAFNFRHLTSGTEEINKNYKVAIKKDDQEYAKLSISKDWNVLDFHSIVVHLFSRESRKQFDIEQLWAVGEKYDDLTNFGSPKSTSDNTNSLSTTKI